MKRLDNILSQLTEIKISGNTETTISAIEFDSRKVSKGSLFAAIKGTQSDGHDFIAKAIESGACAIICENLPAKPKEGICWIQSKDSALCLGEAASAFYDNPSKKLHLVGVTGTNGKTTIATLLFRLFQNLGYQCGLLSTIENRINDRIIKATHTTPDAVQMNQLLAEMLDAGCDYVFMEVSSHAVDQKRIAGLHFCGGIFTNLTHDHLDYHGTFANYIKAKKAFFDHLPKNAFALTNADDKNGMTMLQNTKARKKTYSLRQMADYKCRIIENQLEGLQLNINGTDLWSRLAGHFNASNLTAIYGAAMECGQNKLECLEAISNLHPAEGRMEIVRNEGLVTGILDYAHTPDALKNVLETLQETRPDKGNIITVFGAGGDRDRSKRPEMGEIAARLSDRTIITSDNPRTENPVSIIREIEAGLNNSQKQNSLSISRRDEAIRTAVMLAQPGDIILVAGKGHEKYQEINKVKHPFDDREILLNALKNSKK